MNEQKLNQIERWVKWHFRPCSDAYSRYMELIEQVRADHGWVDPQIPVPTLASFIEAQSKVTHQHEDDWAMVELFRIQYGNLPTSDDTRKLDVSVGLKKLADIVEEAVETSDMRKMPTPTNLVEVLRFCARHVRE